MHRGQRSITDKEIVVRCAEKNRLAQGKGYAEGAMIEKDIVKAVPQIKRRRRNLSSKKVADISNCRLYWPAGNRRAECIKYEAQDGKKGSKKRKGIETEITRW